ncbi:hypothetical protein BJ875DRAFT_8329 [Amylocarpus encephaloides]|uniref:Aminoglycoside phosphotransferase domain-containing protein n=1 Tax=Amylocarpus encephaloides TaxID=45428 RepID=A0A9P8C704_9HELO|nr:hypothetical protein BJ875DRAFT_8329 [Amylocarpus encephaloides]
MLIFVNTNADMPACLNTEQKQAKKAMQLAELHSGIPAKRAQGPRTQGFFSRTMLVTLQDSKEEVIQFRPEPLDVGPFKIARQALGQVVPDIELLNDEELEREHIWTYWMNRIPGKTWSDGRRGGGSKALVTINKSLGRILSRGYVEGNSANVVDSILRPHLEMLLSTQKSEVQPFREVAQEFLGKLDQLKRLPLFISHFDLNQVNILIDESYQVSGIVDWELSSLLPFGMGLRRIHTLAGEFLERKFHMPGEFEESERGFWEEIFNGVPVDVRRVLDANLEAVQTSVLLGTLLGAFELDDGKFLCNPVMVSALPKFLSYRIPFLRGSDPPYAR